MTCPHGNHKAPRASGHHPMSGAVTFIPAPRRPAPDCPTCATPKPTTDGQEAHS